MDKINNNNNEDITTSDDIKQPSKKSIAEDIDSLVSDVQELNLSTGYGIDSDNWSQIIESQKNGTNLKSFFFDIDREDKVCIEKQTKIGEYSVKLIDNERQFVADGSEKKYLHIPQALIHLDLMHGYDPNKHWGKSSPTKIYKLLQWISNTDKQSVLKDTDFVSSRSLFVYILTFPYERFYRQAISVVRFNGVIYMTPISEQVVTAVDNYKKSSFSWSRFEQYMASGDPQTPPEADKVDIDFNSYFNVINTRLTDKSNKTGGHSLVYCSKQDCISPSIPAEPTSLANSVKLAVNLYSRTKPVKKFKGLKWWAQAYLSGAPTIYCGHRDSNFVVNSVEQIDVKELPNTAFWCPEVCLNFMNKFLTHVKEVVTSDDPRVVYQFVFEPKQDITCTRLSEPGVCPPTAVLPDWYI